MKLTIGIPTYNRAIYLDKCLMSINQASKKCPGIDLTVFVSDNNSTDSTEAICKKWHKFINIVHKKNNTNVGAVKNLIKTLSVYEGEGYFWFFGDDDELEENAILNVYSKLKARDTTDILLLNRFVCDQNLNKLYIDKPFKSKLYIRSFDSNKSIINYLNDVSNAAGIFGLISCVIISGRVIEFIDSNLEDDKFWDTTLFPHVYFILLFISKIQNQPVEFIYDDNPSVLFRSGLMTKGTGSELKNSFIDFEHFYNIAKEVFENDRIIFESFLNMIRKFYTLKRHYSALNNISEQDKIYFDYVIGLLFPTKRSQLYFMIVNRFLFVYKLLKYFKN